MKKWVMYVLATLVLVVSIPGLVTPVSGPSETSIPGNRKP